MLAAVATPAKRNKQSKQCIPRKNGLMIAPLEPDNYLQTTGPRGETICPIEGVMEPEESGSGIKGGEGLGEVEGLGLLTGKLVFGTGLDGKLPPPLPSLASAPASRMKAARPSRATPVLSGAKRF